MWNNKRPQIKYQMVFEALIFVLKPITLTWKGILLGYEANVYKLWHVENEKYVIVRDIIDKTNFLVSERKDKNRGNNSNNLFC